MAVPGHQTYNGVKTILVSSALNLLTKAMENFVFPFTYDHAVAITRQKSVFEKFEFFVISIFFLSYDLWSPIATDPSSTRSSLIG